MDLLGQGAEICILELVMVVVVVVDCWCSVGNRLAAGASGWRGRVQLGSYWRLVVFHWWLLEFGWC